MTDDTYPELNLDLDPADGLDAPLAMSREREVPAQAILGAAGVGKSYEVMRRASEDPQWAQLSSTTGISSINLGCTTINSLLGYFDTASLHDLYLQGRLTQKLLDIAEQGYQNLLVEEVSMLDGEQLDLLWRALQEVAQSPRVERPLGLVVVGDFAQLPVVKGHWAFEAQCWDAVAANTLRLTEVKRQHDPKFLAALHATRRGAGAEAAALLTEAGLEWHTGLDTEFDGTTILPRNDMVNRYNLSALDRVRGTKFSVSSQRWGKQRSEWSQSKRTGEWGIPPQSEFKIGALVMILANKFVEGELVYANGDTGHVEEWDDKTREVVVRLVRTGECVRIGAITRDVAQKDAPDGWVGPGRGHKEDRFSGYLGRTHRNKSGAYVLGQISYYPLRLAYATTVHRSQSLTLDRVQVDIRDHFFKSPAMTYVAISRCRTLAGLRLVGQRERFAQHCKSDPRVARFL